ncbi:MAG: 50S ribosomal protein L21 [Lentisphaerae bacterium]|nr:50S ribosomal protein L21 [Lentisphaerota bacterium]
MKAYAVIQTGGKQHRVHAGERLAVERLPAKEGDKVDTFPVLAVSDGTTLTLGKPQVAGAKVSAVVLEHKRGKKVVSFKKKRRKSYERKVGHRQELTILKIESVT